MDKIKTTVIGENLCTTPSKKCVSKTDDVCFVEGCYGIRKKMVKAIETSGVSVAAYGNDWARGRIGTEDVPRLFAESKIILDVSDTF